MFGTARQPLFPPKSAAAAYRRSRAWSVGLLVAAALVGIAFAQERPPAQRPAAPAEVRDLPELHLLIRSRRYEEALAAAERFAQSGQTQPALETLQWILARPFDVLVRDANGNFRSARGEAERQLRALPVAARNQYQRVTGAAAAGEWNRVTAPYDAAACLAQIRTYFATESGYLAAVALVSRWLDEGNADFAASLALRVIDEPAHQRRLTTSFLRRAELACRASGRTAEAERIRALGVIRTADINGESAWVSGPVVPGVSSLRAFQSVSSAAPLTEPAWQAPLDSVKPFPQLADAWRQWSSEKRDKDLPTAIAWRPIVVGGNVVFRDLQAVRAVDVRTGETQWRHAARLGAELLLAKSQAEPGVFRRAPSLWENWESLFANSATGLLTTDGQRIFAIDEAESFVLAARRSTERIWDDPGDRVASNALVALNNNTGPDVARVAWSTATGVGAAEGPLAKHVFLGPPAVTGGMAYCVTEADRELFAVALNASNGSLLWRQPIALADRSILDERQRFLRASVPTVARGLVLCSSHVGLLVAVDAVTGQLRWYHSCLTPQANPAPAQFRPSPSPLHQRQSMFAPQVFACGERAVYLPSQSSFVFCIDLATGREVWRTEQADAEFLGGVTEQQVIVVARGACRAFSLETGALEWSSRLDAVPTGTGVVLADGFLLPLDTGRVLALNLKDGLPIGFDLSTERRPMGHLVLSSDSVLAMGGEGIAAYPQAGPTLRRLQTAERNPETDPLRSLELSDVYLVQGDLTRAVEALQTALPGLRAEQPRGRAERSLREVYFRLLSEQPARSEEWFARLAPLCRTVEQQSRRLIALSGWHWQAGRHDAALQAGIALAALSEDGLHAAPGQAGLEVSIPAWLAALERQSSGGTSLSSQIAARSGTGAAMTARVSELAFRNSPRARTARNELARQDLAAGRFHSAEIRWLRTIQQSDPASAAQATAALARMYEGAGLPARVGELLDDLSTRFVDVECEPGITGDDVVRNWSPQSLGKLTWQRRQPTAGPVDRVRVHFAPRNSSTVGDVVGKTLVAAWDENTEGLYGEFLRPLNRAVPDAPYEWLLKNSGGNSTLMVFDKTASKLLRSVSVAGSVSWPGKEVSGGVGVAQSFGVPAEIRCVSLLQGGGDNQVWSTTLPGWSGRTSVPMCGPATPFGAVYQLRSELIVVDPADGRVLWRRTDLEPGSGLQIDPSIGILTDERIVYVMGADRLSYRIFDLATGELLRQGRLEHDGRSTRVAIGTQIVYQTDSPEGRNLRVWDAASDETILDEPLRDRNFYHVLQYERDVLWISPENRLRVFQCATRRQVVDLPLEPEDLDGVGGTNPLRAFTQGGRYYVNFQHGTPVAKLDQFHEALRDPALVPMVPIRDELLAIEPGRDRPLWRRMVPQRSFVQWGRLPAPVLVGISIIKQRDDNQRRWLRVEALDVENGGRIGYGDRIPEMRLFHADYDGATGTIRLVGDRGDIELRLERATTDASDIAAGG